MRTTHSYFCILATMLAGCSSAISAQLPELPERTDPLIEAIATSIVGTKTPGLGILVMHRGEILHAKAYGVSDVATRTPFTMHTPTYIASVAKMFTAHA